MTLKEFLDKAKAVGIGQDDQLPPVTYEIYQEQGCCCGDCCNSGYSVSLINEIKSVTKKYVELGYAEEI